MRRSYFALAIYASVFLAFGFVFIYSAGISMEARNPYLSASDFLFKQLVAFALGLAGALVIVYFGGSRHFKYVFSIYYPAIILLLGAVFLFPERGGSRRWIDLGFFNLQVSEFAKIVLILLLAKYFADLREKKQTIVRAVIIPFLLAIPLIGLVFIQPDLSTAGILLVLTLMMMLIGGVKISYLVAVISLMVVLVVVGFVYELIEPYQLERITAFFSSFGGEEHEQISYSLMALSSGGLTGTGLGLGVVKYYIPVSYSDFIFAVIGEELGLIGIIILLIAYIGFGRELILAGIRGAKSVEGKLFISGFALYVLLQASVNIAVNLGLFPPTGVTLPFISYGGSSLLSLMIGFGLVFSILSDKEEESAEVA
ncbi:MAG TPA: cell cycle protein [Kosmotogaceae bacterium]|nr:MAG: Cell cycle protein [Thermotogales bacterium 46_20]HAA85189.1 cell cycle protein [Kosmotogaceae bacterium]